MKRPAAPARNAEPPRTIEARRVPAFGAGGPGEFTYTVLIDPVPPHRTGSERRDAPRHPTRLRSGKIVGGDNRFVTECLVRDLSDTGMRLRVPAGTAVPLTFQVYDDQSGVLKEADLLWRRADELGVRFRSADDTLSRRTVAADMRRRFYKLPR